MDREGTPRRTDRTRAPLPRARSSAACRWGGPGALVAPSVEEEIQAHLEIMRGIEKPPIFQRGAQQRIAPAVVKELHHLTVDVPVTGLSTTHQCCPQDESLEDPERPVTLSRIHSSPSEQ